MDKVLGTSLVTELNTVICQKSHDESYETNQISTIVNMPTSFKHPTMPHPLPITPFSGIHERLMGMQRRKHCKQNASADPNDCKQMHGLTDRLLLQSRQTVLFMIRQFKLRCREWSSYSPMIRTPRNQLCKPVSRGPTRI